MSCRRSCAKRSPLVVMWSSSISSPGLAAARLTAKARDCASARALFRVARTSFKPLLPLSTRPRRPVLHCGGAGREVRLFVFGCADGVRQIEQVAQELDVVVRPWILRHR